MLSVAFEEFNKDNVDDNEVEIKDTVNGLNG
jgi:hypothetical protein